MNFAEIFFLTLRRRPLQALSAFYWYLRGRKVRARNRLRFANKQSPYAYHLWIEHIEHRSETRQAAPGTIAPRVPPPHFSVLLHHRAETANPDVLRAVASLGRQCYRDWELVLVQAEGVETPRLNDVPQLVCTDARASHAAEALQIGLAAARGSHILVLPADTQLPQAALSHYAEAIRTARGVTLFYGDHDQIDAQGTRAHPWFKPRWNAELVLAQDYITAACVMDAAAARAAGAIDPALGEAACYALALKLAAATDAEPLHIPHILAHARDVMGPDNRAARLLAVSRHIAASGGTARPGPFGTVTVDWPLPSPLPLVSIIVPTRDAAQLLKACVGGVLTGTSYANFELIIVDNGSREAEALAYLEAVTRDPRVRVLRYDHPYNYSAINNFAVAQARGQFICLLNNDTEVLGDDWLSAMMRYAVRGEVGAVGAKLLYPDGSIQHAGVVVGLGEAAGHAHRFLPCDQPGYFHRAHIAHYASAVTAACLVVAKDKFLDVGGLDAEAFKIAYNDVDLCLKLQAAGWRNVYAPQAVLIHHESKTRGKDTSPHHVARYRAELAMLQSRWHTRTYADPLHHPRLDRYNESFVLPD